MENAAKALTIAGTILISIIVISAFVFMFRDIRGVKRQQADNQKTQAIIDFNKSYESYEKELYGAELLSLANKMWDYNQREGGKDGYKKMILTVTLKNPRQNKNIAYFKGIIDKNKELMTTYKSSNYLEGLHKVMIENPTAVSATQQKKDILNKSGIKESDISDKIEDDYKEYLEYKELKTKKFKCTKTTYSDNGRIETMEFEEE